MHLDRQEFRKWLEQWNPDFMVGVARDYMRCPVATFLKGCGEYSPVVMKTVCRVSGQSKGTPLPRWAKKFVARVDDSHKIGSAVTARSAKHILSAIPEEPAS